MYTSTKLSTTHYISSGEGFQKKNNSGIIRIESVSLSDCVCVLPPAYVPVLPSSVDGVLQLAPYEQDQRGTKKSIDCFIAK